MTNKYHISLDGTPRPCKAQPGNCKLSSDKDHYSNMADARKAAEASMRGEYDVLSSVSKRKVPVAEKIMGVLNSRQRGHKLFDPANGYIGENGKLNREGRAILVHDPEASIEAGRLGLL